ncbi:MAG: MBL fold metallo-hydrolase [Novosphingobium sp.]|nr:MBL fold metallo-hydrolase [Novosphingobium sp.]
MIGWTVGDARITAIPEGNYAFPHGLLLPASTLAELTAIDWLGAPFITPEGNLALTVQAFVIEVDGKRIVVDTCMGNDKPRSSPAGNMMQTDFLERFEGAGFARESIDFVLCTHLHVDHVGWNTMLEDGRWIPTFPNARYLIGRAEYEFWRATAAARGGDDAAILADSVQPLFDHGVVELVATDHAICPEVKLAPTPGHTPGHVSVRIESAGERALLSGDFLHNPAQIARPDWGAYVDEDSIRSETTRRAQLDEIADLPVLLIGTHFPAPTAGYVERNPAGFRFRT